MYYETRDYPTTSHRDEGYERGTREKANWGLGLGIFGAVTGGLALLNRGGIGSLAGVGGGGVPANVNINGGGGFSTGPTAFEAYQHECEDILALTNELWRQKTGTLVALAEQRNVDVREKFGLYVNNRDNIDRVNDRVTNELFSLYKYTRDQDDTTKERNVILHIRSASILEIFEDGKFFPKDDVITFHFKNTNTLGIEEFYIAVLHYTATMDTNVDKKEIINRVMIPAAKWFCDYCDCEDKNVLK